MARDCELGKCTKPAVVEKRVACGEKSGHDHAPWWVAMCVDHKGFVPEPESNHYIIEERLL